MSQSFLIKKATLLHPGHSFHSKKVDVRVVKGKLTEISKSITAKSNEKVIDNKSMYISSGWIDMRCHLTDPGNEHKDTIRNLQDAAAAGGFTAICTLPNSEPRVNSKSVVNYIRESAGGHRTEVLPYGAVSNSDSELAEMYDMHQNFAIGFTDGDKGTKPSMLKKALLYTKSFMAPIISLPLDPDLHQNGIVNESETTIHTGLKSSSSLAEYTAVSQQLKIAEYCEAPIHFTGITCKESVDLIRKAKKAGQPVSCDTTIFNLCFTDKNNLGFDENFKLFPLLRSEKDRKALVKGVNDGTIDAISSNHNPQNSELKTVEFDYADFGALSLQLMLPWYVKHLKNDISMEAFVACLTHKPRKVLGKPIELEKGTTANLTVWDIDTSWEFNNHANKSQSKNSHELGETQKGQILAVVNS